MSTTIEQLEIEVQSNSTSAVSGIDALSESLRRLKAATAPVSKGGVGLGALSNSLKKFSQSVSGLTGLSLAKEQMQGLVDALKPLESVQKSGFNSLASGLDKLVKIAPQLDSVTESIKKTDLDAFAAQCNRVATAITPLATQMEKVSAGFSAFSSRFQRLVTGNANLSKSNTALGASYVNLTAKISLAYVSLRKAIDVIGNWITSSNQYIENLNLFNVSMGQYTSEAEQYAEQVGEIMGIDPGEWMRNQGIFMTLADGFGVAGERAYIMSQNLTQLTYDLASFFNISTEEAFQKLESGISGELEPLRRLGYDLSVARLQQEAFTLGIEKSVSAMTQAEKAELRYYAIMTQVTSAQGDMARTLEAPANQLRILKAQVEQATRALGNIFIPILNAVLPYAIAFAKVIRLIADIIAGLFGFKLPEIDYGGMESMAGGAGELSNNLENATKQAKEMKNALLGIDELNIISPPDNSGGEGADVIGSGGLGFELPTYDFIGESTSNRINDIVQSMKEWLGITDGIDSWSELFNTRLGKILAVVGLIGGAFLAWKISKPFVAAFNVISSLFGGRKSSGKSQGISVPSPKTVLKGLADIAIIVGGVITLIEAIGLLMQIPGFEQTAKKGIKAVGIVFSGLGDVILPLAAVSAGVVLLSKTKATQIADGFASFAIVVGGTSVLITAIGVLLSLPYYSEFLSTGVSSVVSVFNGLWEIALPIGALSALLVGLGIATPTLIISGLEGLAIVIGGVELVLVALGALNQIPGFSWIVGEGGKVLIQLGEILGGFAGSIVKGFLVKVSDSFPEIGRNLAGFMTEAQPFFVGLDSINADSMDAVKKLAEMILILTAADVLDGLTSWITGGTSITEFGQKLCDFAPYLVRYSKSVKGIDAGAVEVSAIAAKSLAEFAKNIPNSGGLAGFFAGENDIDVWGKKLPTFGRNFKRYSDSVKGIDAGAVEASATAAKSLAEFADNIPNEGGVVAWFTGENNIDVWGKKLPEFGKNFLSYYSYIHSIDNGIVKASSSAVESVVKFADNIPNEGGLVAWFTGENSIDVWGKKLPDFGKNFLRYYSYMHSIDPNVVRASSAAVESIVKFADNIPNEGGIRSWFVGNNSISSFAEGLVAFGQNFQNYYGHVSKVNLGTISIVSSEMNKILDWSMRVSSADKSSIKSFGDAIEKLGENFADCAGNIIQGFTGKISSAYTISKSSVVSWAKNVTRWFTDKSYGSVNKDTWSKYASDIIDGFRNKLSASFESNRSSVVLWANSIKSWFTGVVSKDSFYHIAIDVIDGFNSGINNRYQTSRAFMAKWANDTKNTFKKTIDSNSPSKVFERIGEDTVRGYNLGIETFGHTTKNVVDKWASSFTGVNPTMRFAVDTSALRYYTNDSFTKDISVDVTNSRNISVNGFKEGMEEFYREYMEPTLNQMAEDMRRQADKEERTVVQIGNRTVNDAVTTQRKANGYAFVK